jgi:hypothetical protein
MNDYVNIILQVLVALVLVYVLYIIGLRYVIANDFESQDKATTQKTSVKVIDGRISGSALVGKKFDTINVASPTYVPIKPSVNSCDGIAFTYSFWILLKDSTTNIDDLTIFIKGNASKYQMTKQRAAAVGSNSSTVNDYIVKCPSFKFGKVSKSPSFKIEFNTLKKIDNHVNVSSHQIINSNVPDVDGALKHMLGRWSMITLVFSDHRRYDGIYDGIQVSFFLNDALYSNQSFVGDALRWNNSDLVFFPDAAGSSVSVLNNLWIADFYYANYALDPIDIKNRFNAGFNNNLAVAAVDDSTPPDTLGLTPMNLTGMFYSPR